MSRAGPPDERYLLLVLIFVIFSHRAIELANFHHSIPPPPPTLEEEKKPVITHMYRERGGQYTTAAHVLFRAAFAPELYERPESIRLHRCLSTLSLSAWLYLFSFGQLFAPPHFLFFYFIWLLFHHAKRRRTTTTYAGPELVLLPEPFFVLKMGLAGRAFLDVLALEIFPLRIHPSVL